MNEQQEVKIRKELLEFFRLNFTYIGLSEKQKEDRIFKLTNDVFLLFMRYNKKVTNI